MAKAKKQSTVVALVLDETGSMSGIANDTRGSINEYFKTVAEESPDALVSIMEFSDTMGTEDMFRPLCSGVKATEVPQLTDANYRPRGNTPLYDAIGKAIRDTETIKADRYLLVVMTDGYENASREWTRDKVKALIEEKENTKKWTVVFLGANMDAFAVGAAMGTNSSMTYTSTASGTATASAGLSMATKTFLRSPQTSTQDFFGDAGQTEEDYKDK